MVVAAVEFEGAPILERIETLKVGKLWRNGDGPSLFCLTIEDCHFVPIRFQGGSKVGQPYGLNPDRSAIKILDRRLYEKNFHRFPKGIQLSIVNRRQLVHPLETLGAKQREKFEDKRTDFLFPSFA
jgi:hypothetical protein